MNYIITKNPSYFTKIGNYKFCNLEDMSLPDTIAVDTETTGLKPRNCDIFCVQIGTGKNNYIIVLYATDGVTDDYSFEDLKSYLQDKEMIFHNATFDVGFMNKYDFWPTHVRDTMMASKILYNGKYEDVYGSLRPVMHNFGACMVRELKQYYDKTTQKNIHIVKLSQKSTIDYSFNDVDRLIELHTVLSEKIDIGGFRETYDLHCQYSRALAYMEACGMPINAAKWENKMEQDIKDTFTWSKTITEYIHDHLPRYADKQIDMFDTVKRILIKITSPKQMIDVFNAFGVKTKDKDDKDSIKENVISKTKHDFVDMWLKYQGAKHRVTTFGQKIYDKIEDGRLYTSFNPMVDTARLSSRRGSINFLNFPNDKLTRDCFESVEGTTMIVCDWSGQETVIIADFSGDEAMTKSVVEGADLHCLLARVLFPELEELSDDEIVTNHKGKRSASKAPRFNKNNLLFNKNTPRFAYI